MFPLVLFGGIALALLLGSKSSAPQRDGWGPTHLATAADVDAGCPPEILASLNAWLVAESDPALFRQYAATLRPYYPRAASILDARANALGR